MRVVSNRYEWERTREVRRVPGARTHMSMDRKTGGWMDGLEILLRTLNASQGYLLRELHGCFSADGNNDIAQGPSVEASFTVREIVLMGVHGQYNTDETDQGDYSPPISV